MPVIRLFFYPSRLLQYVKKKKLHVCTLVNDLGH